MNNFGYTVLLNYLKEVGLPPVPSFLTLSPKQLKNFTFDWMKADVNVKMILGMDLFIPFEIEPYVYNTSYNVMYMGSSRSKSPLPT